MTTKPFRSWRLLGASVVVVLLMAGVGTWIVLTRGSAPVDYVSAAKRNLERATERSQAAVDNAEAADRAVRHMGFGKTIAAEGVHAVGRKFMADAVMRERKAWFEFASAEMGARLTTDCTYGLARFENLNRAEEAFATLTLSGIEEALIRPGKRSKEGDSGPYDLLVRPEERAAALAALNGTRICELQRVSYPQSIFPILDVLNKEGVPVACRLLSLSGPEGKPYYVHAIYVRQEDQKSALRLLEAMPVASVVGALGSNQR
jgi:hypothetical protein